MKKCSFTTHIIVVPDGVRRRGRARRAAQVRLPRHEVFGNTCQCGKCPVAANG